MIEYYLDLKILKDIRNEWLREMFLLQIQYDQQALWSKEKDARKTLSQRDDLEEKVKFLDKYIEKAKNNQKRLEDSKECGVSSNQRSSKKPLHSEK